MADPERLDNLVALMFEGMGTAAAVYEQIEGMEKENLLSVTDAIIIERESGGTSVNMMTVAPATGQGTVTAASGSAEDQVRVTQTHGKKGKYAATGGGVGLLAGFLLGGPIGGLIVGAGLGALTAAMKDFGIDDKGIDVIKARLQPNSSALIILGHVDDREAFLEELRTFEPQVVMSTLSPEVEKELRARLGS
jgi:uncharacterized membrane protein